MGNGVRGMGYKGYVTWAMGTWTMGYRGIGNWAHGQWGPWVICTQNVKKMSSCQKDVKCQKIKGGFTRKLNVTQWDI